MKLLWKAKMSTIQDEGEEVEEGAVYHVTLKRVQIQQAANKGARWLGEPFIEEGLRKRPSLCLWSCYWGRSHEMQQEQEFLQASVHWRRPIKTVSPLLK
uniref:Uncharacterized protein n=1 Tax=Strigops habroptila TaxID=2489341 RepID=A0A672UQY4_STRHB